MASPSISGHGASPSIVVHHAAPSAAPGTLPLNKLKISSGRGQSVSPTSGDFEATQGEKPELRRLGSPRKQRSGSISSNPAESRGAAKVQSARVRSVSIASEAIPKHSPVSSKSEAKKTEDSEGYIRDFIAILHLKREKAEALCENEEEKEGFVRETLEKHLKREDKLEVLAQIALETPDKLKMLMDGIKDMKLRSFVFDKLIKCEGWKAINEEFLKKQNAKLDKADPNAPNFEMHQTILNLMNKLNHDIESLEKKYPTDPGTKSRLVALKTLKLALHTDPQGVAKAIEENRSQPLYKSLGALTFISSLMQVRANIKDNPGISEAIKNADRLSDSEKVAIYGYTTNDYGAINKTLRDRKGGYSDQKALEVYQEARTAIDRDLNRDILVDTSFVTTYMSTLLAALQKLPVISAEENGKKVEIKRGFKLPSLATDQEKQDWFARTYKDGEKYSDSALTSSTRKVPVGEIIVTYKNKEHADTWPAKDVCLFSAWPGEGELIFPPGVTFHCKKTSPKTLEMTVI